MSDEKPSRMFSWMNPKLEVRNTEKYGKGVFAVDDISKGEKVAIFGGYVVKLNEEIEDTGIQIDDDLILASFEHTEPTDFINHSCNPNCGLKGQIFLVSMRDVKKGEQITFDYAMCLFSKSEIDFYSFKCMCNENNCRRIVTSNDWEIQELRNKYRGYFQLFLQEKINIKL